ncbi:hypothetical protein, partial [Azospirillum sp. TSO5]|uniref:hypothetical protein n=1 Tax=Azospirillum sp. TSO5 TaxID=716760 RepID=UPI0018EEA5D0
MTSFQAVKGVRRVTPFITWDSAYGIYDANYPVTNLGNDDLARVCRTGAATLRANRFKGTLDRERAAMLMGFVHHTCGLNDRFRVRLYGNAGKPFTADQVTDHITIAAHGLSTGTSATVWNRDPETGSLPGGLVDGTVYYVRVIDANTLTLHQTAGAAASGTGAVDITTAGVGVHEILSDLRYDPGW